MTSKASYGPSPATLPGFFDESLPLVSKSSGKRLQASFPGIGEDSSKNYISDPSEGDLGLSFFIRPGHCVGHFVDPLKGCVDLDLGYVNLRGFPLFDVGYRSEYPTKSVGEKEVAVLVPLQLIPKSPDFCDF